MIVPNSRRGARAPAAATLTLADGARLRFPGAAAADRVPRRRSGARRWLPVADPSDPTVAAYYELNSPPDAPRLHLLPSGDVLCADPVRGRTLSFTPGGRNGGVFIEICLSPAAPDGPSALLPLRPSRDYGARVLRLAGASAAFQLDLAGWRPGATGGEWSWRKVAPPPAGLGAARFITLLPDGRVLASGGGGDGRALALHDPDAYAWSPLAPARFAPRRPPVPDAEGGARDADGAGVLWTPARDGRPRLGPTPRAVSPGEVFEVETDADALDAFVFARRGAGSPADARLVELAAARAGPGRARIALPDDPALLPPGDYWMFAVRGAGRDPRVSRGRPSRVTARLFPA